MSRMISWQSLIVSMTGLVLVGCAATESVQQEEQTGVEVVQQVEEQIGVYNDDYLKNYVDAVGRRLVAELGDTPHTFRFHIIDQPEPNAFATPAGYIYISRGLMAVVNTEDELAGVLAHQISHVTQRHQATLAAHDGLPGLLTIPGQVVGSVVSDDVGELTNAPLTSVGKVYLSSYGRDQEIEADRMGMRLAAEAGYDPASLAQLFDNVARTVELLTAQQQQFSFFKTHPAPPGRNDQIEGEAARIAWRPAQPFAKNQAALFKRLDGLWWGPGNPAQGVFEGQAFKQPDLNFTITFPEGWQTVNTPRFVGAFPVNQAAVVVLGTAGRPADPAQFAQAFAEQLSDEAGVEPTESRPVKLGEWPGHLVRIADESGESPVSIYYLWVSSPRLAYKLIAAGSDEYRDALRDTALSLRNMTPEEAASIVSYRIRIAAAAAGESLTALSARTDNAWEPELTAATNGLPVDIVLADGQLVKVLIKEIYLR